MGGIISREDFAPVMLVVSSMTAYVKVPPTRTYARTAYRMYCLTGMAHMASMYLGYSGSWKKPLEIAFTWSYALGLPLLAAEICNHNGVFPGLATMHIIVPTATLIIYHYDVDKLDPYMLGVSHGYSMLSMVACGIVENHLCPYAMTAVYYFTLFQYFGMTIMLLDPRSEKKGNMRADNVKILPELQGIRRMGVYGFETRFEWKNKNSSHAAWQERIFEKFDTVKSY